MSTFRAPSAYAILFITILLMYIQEIASSNTSFVHVHQVLILNKATVQAVDKKGVTREYMANDLVCVVVSEVNVEAERVVAVMNVPAREGQAPHPPLGLIHSDDLPEAYK